MLVLLMVMVVMHDDRGFEAMKPDRYASDKSVSQAELVQISG